MMTPGQPQHRQSLLSYVAAVSGVAAATGIICLVPVFKERGAFLIYLAVVALVTWFGGWRPGLVAIGLTSIVCLWLILPPTDSFRVGSWEDGLRLVVFVLVAVLIAALHASRERAIARTWQTEQRLAFALECAHMGVWHSDLKTGRIWWSEGMETLFGRPPGEFVGTYEGFIAYIHPDDQDFVKRAIMQSGEGKQDFEIEHRIVRPDGEPAWIVTRGRIILDEHGKPRQIIAVAANVSHAKTGEG